jgi:PadR family transcriptional regulator PadR
MDEYDHADEARAEQQTLTRRRVAPQRRETILLQGTLDVLVMKALDGRRLTEYGIRKRIREMTGEIFVVPQTSAMKATVRLTRDGWIRQCSSPQTKPGTKSYKLTLGARSHLKGEIRKLTRKLDALLAFIGS